MKKIIKVNNCYECPFYMSENIEEEEGCGYQDTEVKEKGFVFDELVKKVGIPKNCPVEKRIIYEFCKK